MIELSIKMIQPMTYVCQEYPLTAEMGYHCPEVIGNTQTQFIVTPYFLDEPRPQLEELAQPGWIVNRQSLPEGEVQARMSVYHESLAHLVSVAINAGQLPVSIAGDCCAAIGVVAGLQRAGLQPLLLWLDAHGDFNTWQTTPSGFLGGMPLAMLAGLGEQTLLQRLAVQPVLAEQIILTDGRDLDPGERELVANSGIIHLPDPHQLLAYDLGTRPLHIHFDVDILSPLDAPAMSYRAEGGPRAAELTPLFRHLAITGRITAVSMSTWNPELDSDGRSREISLQLLHELLPAA